MYVRGYNLLYEGGTPGECKTMNNGFSRETVASAALLTMLLVN